MPQSPLSVQQEIFSILEEQRDITIMCQQCLITRGVSPVLTIKKTCSVETAWALAGMSLSLSL